MKSRSFEEMQEIKQSLRFILFNVVYEATTSKLRDQVRDMLMTAPPMTAQLTSLIHDHIIRNLL